MAYQYRDFSKADKAILREILSLGAKREIESFLKESFPQHRLILEEDHEDIRQPFWELSNKFKVFSKHILRKYDHYSHSEIPLILANLLYGKFLTQEDISDFSIAGKEKINDMTMTVASFRKT